MTIVRTAARPTRKTAAPIASSATTMSPQSAMTNKLEVTARTDTATAVMEVTGVAGYEVKHVMRTGTVASVDNRNWELQGHNAALKRFEQLNW